MNYNSSRPPQIKVTNEHGRSSKRGPRELVLISRRLLDKGESSKPTVVDVNRQVLNEQFKQYIVKETMNNIGTNKNLSRLLKQSLDELEHTKTPSASVQTLTAPQALSRWQNDQILRSIILLKRPPPEAMRALKQHAYASSRSPPSRDTTEQNHRHSLEFLDYLRHALINE